MRMGEKTNKFQDQISIFIYRFLKNFILVVFICLAAWGSLEPSECGAVHHMGIAKVWPYGEMPHMYVWT